MTTKHANVRVNLTCGPVVYSYASVAGAKAAAVKHANRERGHGIGFYSAEVIVWENHRPVVVATAHKGDTVAA